MSAKLLRKVIGNIDQFPLSELEKLIGEGLHESDIYRTLLDSLPEGHVIVTRDHRVVFVSKAMSRLIPADRRYRLREGVRIESSVFNKDVKDYMIAVLSGKERAEARDFAFQAGEGASVMRVSFRTFEVDDESLTDITVRDITEEINKETKLRRSESLASMTTMAAGIAHEIKNPLAAIKIHLQLLRKAFRSKGRLSEEDADRYLSVLDEEMPGIYTEEASLDPMLIRRAVRERNYRLLPGSMAELAGECHDIFLRTRDGQLCDIMIDRAALAAMQEAAARTGDAVLKSYASIRAAAADIKIASRAVMTGKDETFLDRALAECDGLDREKLIKAAASGMEGIYAYLENTDFSDAIPELRRSQAAFERWCDDKIIREIKPQLWNSFGLGPIAAYIIARETEIRSVRILLAAKQNGFPEDMIRERIRETYV